MAENKNVKRIVQDNRTDLTNALKAKMIGIEEDGNNLGFKKPNGHMEWYAPEDGDAKYNNLIINSLAGGGNQNVSVDNNGQLIANVGGSQNLLYTLSAGNNAGGQQIKGLADPTDLQDAVNKKYVDVLVGNLTGLWIYTPNTTSPLEAGYWQPNNSDPLLATQLNIHKVDNDGIDKTNLIKFIDGGGEVLFQDINDNNKYYMYEVTAGSLILNGDIYTMDISLKLNGSTPMVDGDINDVKFDMISTTLYNLQQVTDSGATTSNIMSYTTHPTFGVDTQIVDKKYVDDHQVSIPGNQYEAIISNGDGTAQGTPTLVVDDGQGGKIFVDQSYNDVNFKNGVNIVTLNEDTGDKGVFSVWTAGTTGVSTPWLQMSPATSGDGGTIHFETKSDGGAISLSDDEEILTYRTITDIQSASGQQIVTKEYVDSLIADIGILSAKYKFSTSLAGDPGTGHASMNHSDPTVANILSVNHIDSLGNDRSYGIGALDVGDYIAYEDRNTSDHYIFKVTQAPVDQSGYSTIAVTPISNAGTLNNNENITVELLFKGAKTFDDLNDTPNDKSTEGGKFVAVKSDGSALEYVDAPSNNGLWDQTNNILAPITDPDQLQLGGGFSTGKLDINQNSTFDRVELTGLEITSQALVDANGIYNKIDDSKYKHETYDYWIIDTGWWWVITNDETNAWNGAMAEGSGGRPTPVDGAYYQGLNGYYGDILVNDTAGGSAESITAYDKIYSRDVIKTSNSFQVGSAYSMGTNLDGENSVGIAEAPVNNISMKWIQDEGSGNSKDVMALYSMGNLRLPDCDVSDITDDKDVITKEYLINNAPSAGLGDVLDVSNDANGNGISKLGWLQSENWNTVDDGQFYLGSNGYQWKSGTGLHDVKFEHNYDETNDLLNLNYQTKSGTDKCVISMNGDGSASLPNCDVSDITDDNDIVTKEYLVTNYTEEAPQDGRYYTRKDGAWKDTIVGATNDSTLNMIPYMKDSTTYGDSIIEQGSNMLMYHAGNGDEETIDIELKPSDLVNTSYTSVRHMLNRTLDGGTGTAGILATTDMTEFINHYSGAYITRDYADANYGGGTNSSLMSTRVKYNGDVNGTIYIPRDQLASYPMGILIPNDGRTYKLVGLVYGAGLSSVSQASTSTVRIASYDINNTIQYSVGGGTTLGNENVFESTGAVNGLYYREASSDLSTSPITLPNGKMIMFDFNPDFWTIKDLSIDLLIFVDGLIL